MVQDLFESVSNAAGGLCFDRYRPGALGKHVYARQKVAHAVVKRGKIRDVRQICLVEVRYDFRERPASRESNPPQFVHRVGVSTGEKFPAVTLQITNA